MIWTDFVLSILLSLILLVPLIIKWELEKKIAIPTVLFIGLITGLIARQMADYVRLNFYMLIAVQAILIMVLATLGILWRFYRDPDRSVPYEANIILSPADGKIIYTKKIENDEIPFCIKKGKKMFLKDLLPSRIFDRKAFIIGIGMSFLDVHVNRSPIEGKVVLLRHIKGKFLSLKKKEALLENERFLILIENGQIELGIIQIASRMVRRIVPYISLNQRVVIGERIGMIRFGSQVDVVIPARTNVKLEVKPGNRVKAGMTVLASYQ
jgi:phosphatidylserine decarboxylase